MKNDISELTGARAHRREESQISLERRGKRTDAREDTIYVLFEN